MKFNFNLTGEARKKLVHTLEEILGEKARYLYLPTCAYEVSYFIVTKEGTLTCCDNADPDEVNRIIKALAEKGFKATDFSYDNDSGAPDCEADSVEPYEDCPPPYGSPEPDAPTENTHDQITGMVVSVARNTGDMPAIDRLKNMISSKRTLLMKSLGAESLDIEITESEIRFPWCKGSMTVEDGNARVQLIGAMWKMAREQKRISAIEKPTGNEKYAFRCWLLRLGFIGREYKAVRKILMRNLSGSAAFRDGAKKDGDDE